MKNFLLFLALLITVASSAQIREVEKSKYEVIGKVSPGGMAFISSISVMRDTAVNGTNSYLWMYNNLKYTTITDIKSISFTASNEDFDSLYELLKTQLSAEKGTEKDLELGKSRITIKTIRNLGITSLTIYDLTGGGGYFYLTAKQVDKLFGK